MFWCFPWSDSIKKRACRYLLQHYLGHFLQEKLTLDQLSVDLYNGTGMISDLNLDVASLNKVLEGLNSPVEIVDGFVKSITVGIPWSTLTSDNTVMEISGLELTLQPRESNSESALNLDSMFSSMTTSMQLAQECLRQDAEGNAIADSPQPMEGLEMFAQTIESVLSRIKVTLVDTVIRLEHIPEGESKGVALEVRIKSIEYFDDMATSDVNIAQPGVRNVYEPAAICYKNFCMMGVTLYADIFPESMRERSFYLKNSMISSVRTSGSGASVFESFPSDSNDSELMQIAVLSGRQEMKVKVKQCESMPGPKLDASLHIGSIHSILSPKYVHVLLTLCGGFESNNESNADQYSMKTVNKPMGSFDFERVETELQRQFKEGHRAQIMTNMLRTDSYDDDPLFDESFASEGMYYSMNQSEIGGSDMTSSTTSVGSNFSSNTSTTNTSIVYNYGAGGYQHHDPRFNPQRRKERKPKSNVQKLLDDPGAELTKYKVKFSFFSLLLLHEDPSDTPSDGIEPGVPGHEKLKEIVEAYLAKVVTIPVHGMDTALDELRPRFAEACPHDHISVLSKPITIDCEMKILTSRRQKSSLAADVSIGTLEIVETLFDRNGFGLRPRSNKPNYEHSELLVFHLPSDTEGLTSIQTAPCVRIKITDYQSSGRDKSSTDISFQLAPVFSEIDVTLIDRIHSLLSPPAAFTNAKHSDVSNCKRTDINVFAGKVTLHVRFPIPDLRSGNAVDKFPWWKRTIHKEILILHLDDLELKSSICADDRDKALEFSALDVHGLFQENVDKEPVSFLRCGYSGVQPDDLVKLVIKISPSVNSRLSEQAEDSDDSLAAEMAESACDVDVDRNPTPFSTNKIIHDNEEVIIPGDRQQMQDFRQRSVDNTRLLIDIHVPNLNALLPSKDFYELLYNRINGDLLLWVPQAPSPIFVSQSTLPKPGLDLVNQVFYDFDEYLPCKSGVRYDSSSESEDDFSMGPEQTLYHRDMKRNSKSEKSRIDTQNRICVGLSVGFGKVTVHPPVRDDDKESEDERGQLLLEVEDGSLFMVDTTEKITSMSVQATRAALYHDGDRPISTSLSELGRATVAPTDLHPTIYKSDSGISLKVNPNLAMVSIAIKITPQQLSSTASSKEFLVALAINGSTLKHRMTPSRHSWFTQIMDFLDVRDFPIRGYTLPKVITVLHCHIWSCSIDYRPLYLPYRCLVNLENFSVSSNIIAKSMTTLLKFIVEDATLSLSQNLSASGINMHRDYVCVLEVGLFELTLLTSDGRDWKYPRTDLKASNNIIHIRTCSDSCQALKQLILYLSNEGDLREDGEPQVMEPVTVEKEEEEEVDVEHLKHVHDLMVDAMQDATRSASSSPSENEPLRPRNDSNGPTQVFFFPDEHDKGESDDEQVSAPVATIEYEDGDESSVNEEDEEEEVFSGDEEFCIIDDPGLGIAPRDGEPIVRCLTEQPLIVKDNHFSQPLGRTDLLRAPDSFPNAVYRYTLKEMSLVWHIYDGHDFKQPSSSKINMTGAKVSYGKNPNAERSKLNWRVRGGPLRDHSTLMQLYLNKIRLQHEVYPDSTPQASRQIFLVQELEIRDKLSTSQINKFLYQYTCDQMPRQSRANMILVKNVHMRPDLHLPNNQECSLKVSLLPLRFNIDQDSLMFLHRFFMALTVDDEEDESSSEVLIRKDSAGSLADQASSPPKNQPIMGSPCMQKHMPPADKVKFDEFSDNSSTETHESDNQQPTYFKTFVFSPDVLIRLDYHGKRVTMGSGTAGTATGLLAGLAQLNCSEFRLKRIHHRHGLLGTDRVLLHAVNEWLNDIKKNQLPSILGGVGPMHTVLQLFQGVRDLFWLPVEQYKKDGRILRGIQRGANSFTTSTLMAALELTNRSVQSIQYVAELMYDMVSPNLTTRRRKQLSGPMRRQPGDFREGVNNAYLVLKEGFTDTAQTIIQAAQKEHDARGVTGAVGGVLRQIPPTVVQPLILATEATSNVLGGVRNQLMPDVKREEEEKWKQELVD